MASKAAFKRVSVHLITFILAVTPLPGNQSLTPLFRRTVDKGVRSNAEGPTAIRLGRPGREKHSQL